MRFCTLLTTVYKDQPHMTTQLLQAMHKIIYQLIIVIHRLHISTSHPTKRLEK
jgi:hypothetical protein